MKKEIMPLEEVPDAWEMLNSFDRGMLAPGELVAAINDALSYDMAIDGRMKYHRVINTGEDRCSSCRSCSPNGRRKRTPCMCWSS